MTPGIEHLVVRAAEAQPGIHARAHARVGAEEAVGHLERGQLVGVEDLALGHEQPEALAAERHQRGERRGAGRVLEEEGRRVVEAADPERALDQPHGAVVAGQRQLPSPMWLIRIESRGKSIAYISVNWVSPSSRVPADISAAVSASPSAP